MSRVNSVIMGNVTERNKTSSPKNTFFRILRRVQIGVLIIGTLLFLAWCFSYLLHDTRTNSKSNSFKSASLIASEKDCCGAGDKAEHKEDEDIGLLPGNVVPHHYNLTLQLFMPPQYNFTTRGNVEILIECIRETKLIVLHARDLVLESENVVLIDEKPEVNSSFSTNVSTDSQKQQVLIYLNETLQPKSKYILEIPFYGSINNVSVGLYRSSYLAEDGNVSWIASTQFQPSDARRVFPCFDEPSLKATIRLSLICNKDEIALSNMPQTKTESL
ncbi:aminopeptidase 2 [Trichonephila clavipes]|nr:aminopeptidase 2 [Trichonephila clavipes]